MRLRTTFILLAASLILLSCQWRPHGGAGRGRGSQGNNEVTKEVSTTRDNGTVQARTNRGTTKVGFTKENGVLYIPVEINGVPMRFIFDTGASSVTMSLTEANFLAKQGKLTDDDILGSENFMDANGNISEGTEIILRSVRIGDREISNVKASVVMNQRAPLLFGQTAMAAFGKVSIDYNKNVLILE